MISKKLLFAMLAMSLWTTSSLLWGSTLDYKKIDQKIRILLEEKKPLDPKKPDKISKPIASLDLTITPPFPKSWPIHDDTYIYYGFYSQSAFLDGIADAKYVGQSWGSVSVTIKNNQTEFTYKSIQSDLSKKEIQGVEPISQKEYRILSADPLELLLNKKDIFIKSYYCTWIDLNGVVASHLKNNQESFFKWLGCS